MKRLRLWLALLFASICSLQGVYAATSNSQLLSDASDEDTPFFTEEDSAQIVVSLLEPGSLGTEVLYNVNHINEVYNLKVIGEMNEEDWARIKIMQNLYILDLSEAITDVVPANTFENNKVIKRIKLPNTIKNIEQAAFSSTKTEIFEIPACVEELGNNAFYRSNIEFIDLSKVKNIGDDVFYECDSLKRVKLSESLQTIGRRAFYRCRKLNMRIPQSVVSLGAHSLDATAIDTLILSEKTKVFGGNVDITSHTYSFMTSGDSLKYVDLPSSFYPLFDQYHTPLEMCSPNTVILRTPTLISPEKSEKRYNLFSHANNKENITVKVPDYLVTSYKLHEYWSQFNIVGFKSDLKNIILHTPLKLYSRDRIEGNPNITFGEKIYSEIKGTLSIVGDLVQTVDTITTKTDLTTWFSEKDETTIFYMNSEALKILGTHVHKYNTRMNKWYFISLPFDIKVSDIVPANGGKYAIRYYDGAGRALNGATGNWKNYEADDIIEAGTGFIYQTSQDGWTTFVSLDNESKQNIASNKMFVKALEANPSEKNSNKGWNLVGNPWQAYFNNHSVNFTAPITVWNGTTYVAYSLIDDDYAIKPNEAFFVQCPEEINSISFPITGRQMTNEITNQSGAKPRMFGTNLENRQLIDLSVAKGDLMDKTRVVVNEGASADYETGVDASKFFSMDGAVPQVYTLVGEATECAINERPVAEGLVKVGFMAPEEGSYTFALVRNEAKTVVLIDHETGTTTDLTAGEYNFTAAQGTWNNRFELMITPAEPTAIEGVDGDKETKVTATGEGIVVEGTEDRVVVYSVDGKKVAEQPVDGTATISVAKGTYLVRTAKGTAKVTVR